jgi:hypothetical protein
LHLSAPPAQTRPEPQPGRPLGNAAPAQPQALSPLAGTAPPAATPAPGDFDRIQDAALRSRVEAIAAEKMGGIKEAQLLTSEPWLAPTGEQLAAVVGDRTLTMGELKQRTATMLAQAPPVDDGTLPADQHAELTKERQVAYESTVLNEWIDNTVLAVYAGLKGISTTDAEVQTAYEDLTRSSPGGASKLGNGLYVGFSEAQLRQELRDGLQAEKAVKRGMTEIVTEDKLRRIFNERPDLFVVPDRVKAWQIFYPVIRLLTAKEEKAIASKMNGWRKKLARCKSEADFQALQKELSDTEGLIRRDAAIVQLRDAQEKAAQGELKDPMAIRQAGMQAADLGDPEKPVISDLGWVAEGDPMPQAMHEALFKLDAGDTSDIFKSESEYRSLGYNVVKVVERVKGGQATFDQARPRVENMVYAQVKDLVMQAARAAVHIESDREGLRKWHKVESTPLPVVVPTPAAVVAEPDLSGLRGGENLTPAERALLAPLPAVRDVVRSPATPRRTGVAPLAPPAELNPPPPPPAPAGAPRP